MLQPEQAAPGRAPGVTLRGGRVLCRYLHRGTSGTHGRQHGAQLRHFYVQQAAQRVHLVTGSGTPLPLPIGSVLRSLRPVLRPVGSRIGTVEPHHEISYPRL